MNKHTIVWVLLLSFIITPQVWALKVSPFTATLSPDDKKNSSTTFVLDNDKDTEVFVETEITTRTIDLYGKEERKKSEDLRVYPSQIKLQPKQIKNIRVMWIGPKNIKSEQAYRLTVRQLPVTNPTKIKGSGARGQLTFLFEYVLSVYVRPPNTRAKLTLNSLKEEKDKISFIIKNEGTEHIILKNTEVFLGADSEIQIDPKLFGNDIVENLLPDCPRLFTIKTPPALKGLKEKLKGKIRIKD